MNIKNKDNANPKIMIAHEDIIEISLLENTLSKYGITNVVATADSKKVVDMIKKYKPDLLLLDLDMPNVNDIDVLDYIQRNIKLDDSLEIIACAKQDSQNMIKAQKLGVEKIITKPIKSTQVMNAIWDFIKISFNAKAS